MTDLLTQNISLIAASPNGVKQLRELILQLAVMGKLVRQDPKDEPASELLKKAEVERSQKATARNQKMTAIACRGGDFQVPSGWAWAWLWQLAENIQYGYTASADHSSKAIRMLRITDIQDNRVNWDEVPGCDIPIAQFSDYSLSNGDIAIARTGGTIGKSYLVENLGLKAVFASYLIRIKKLDCMYAPYLKVFLGSQTYWKQLSAKSMGTGQPNVSGTSLKGLAVPIPPLAEQHRIVAKLDELMALCDRLESQQADAEAAHTVLVKTLLDALMHAQDQDDFAVRWALVEQNFGLLFTTETSVHALKKSLLQLAVMGRLVPQDIDDVPAAKTIEMIRAEIAKSSKARKGVQVSPSRTGEFEETAYDLPSGWKWRRLDSIADIGTGKTPPRDRPELFSGGTVAWVTSGLTGKPFITETDEYITTEAVTEFNLRIYPKHTLIVAMYGQGKTRGQITELLIDSTVNQACAAIVLSGTAFEYNRYIRLYFEKIYDEIREKAAGGAQPNLNVQKIKETLIPLPPIAEQQRIVARVDELMALCDRLKSAMSDASSQQTRVATALIEHALLGENVATRAGDTEGVLVAT